MQGGPLACGICSKKLDSYKSGVWMGVDKNCSDHTISIAGYGTSEDGLPYWCAYCCLSATCRLSSFAVNDPGSLLVHNVRNE